MKLLVITQNYPPYHIGGYELRCKEVLDNLIKRGHEIEIITTKVNSQRNSSLKSAVHRKLHIDDGSGGFISRLIFGYLDIVYLNKIIGFFQPDVIYLWQVAESARTLFPYLAEIDLPIVIDEGGVGIRRAWQSRGIWHEEKKKKIATKIKKIAKRQIIKFANIISNNLIKREWAWPRLHAYFNSELNRNNARQLNIPLLREIIIHSGIDTQQFPFKPRFKIDLPVKIITPGRITPQKGIEDCLMLVKKLLENEIRTSLKIIGPIGNRSFFEKVIDEIKASNLENSIEYLPMQDRSALASYYQEADVCFFPSYNRTGFSRVPMEAMASGSLVLTYGNEGSDEIITNGDTGLIVEQGDINAAAIKIREMILDSTQYNNLVQNAYNLILRDLTIDKYVDNIERFLNETVEYNKKRFIIQAVANDNP